MKNILRLFLTSLITLNACSSANSTMTTKRGENGNLVNVRLRNISFLVSKLLKNSKNILMLLFANTGLSF